jgi:ribosome-associated protein
LNRIAPKALAKKIIRIAWNKKAEDIVLLDLKKISSVTDYFVVCSVGSDIQARVVADAVIEELKGKSVLSHVEGYESGRWILIDCFGVVLHVFRPEVRQFYGLERLWGDAPREEFPDGL